MPTALIRGPQPRLAAIAAALQRNGIDAIVSPAGDPRPSRSLESLNGYVGLAVEESPDLTGSVRAVLATIEDLISVVPILTADAVVLIVTDAPGGDRSLAAATRLLATAVLPRRGSDRLAVLTEPCTPLDIAAAMSAGPPGPIASASVCETTVTSSLADVAPQLGYADWRNEVLSLTADVEGTYFGWVSRDDELLLGVLRGAVLTPLRPTAGNRARAADPVDRSVWLARVVLADLLGGEASQCPACLGASEGCVACESTGLSDRVLDLADLLTKELLGFIPEQGVELSASALRDWIEQVPGGLRGFLKIPEVPGEDRLRRDQ